MTSTANFDTLLSDCVNRILRSGLKQSNVPEGLQDWLAGKILRILPDQFIDNLLGYLSNSISRNEFQVDFNRDNQAKLVFLSLTNLTKTTTTTASSNGQLPALHPIPAKTDIHDGEEDTEILGLQFEDSDIDESENDEPEDKSNDAQSMHFWKNILNNAIGTSNPSSTTSMINYIKDNADSSEATRQSNGSYHDSEAAFPKLPRFPSASSSFNNTQTNVNKNGVKTIDLTTFGKGSGGHQAHHMHNPNQNQPVPVMSAAARYAQGAPPRGMHAQLQPRYPEADSPQALCFNSHGNHICRICNIRFTRQKLYAKHMVKAHGEKPYKCPICGKPSGRSDYILTHMRRKHPEELAQHHKMKTCKHCGQLVHERGMQHHMATYHAKIIAEEQGLSVDPNNGSATTPVKRKDIDPTHHFMPAADTFSALGLKPVPDQSYNNQTGNTNDTGQASTSDFTATVLPTLTGILSECLAENNEVDSGEPLAKAAKVEKEDGDILEEILSGRKTDEMAGSPLVDSS